MALLARRNMRRVPRVGLLYSEIVQGIPPMFPCLVDKIPSVHVVFVFMSIKNLPIPRVAPPERFIFRRVGPTKHRMFRRVARYGYTDQIEGTNEFSVFLIEGLKLFVHDEAAFSCEHTDNGGDNNNNDNDDARRVAQAAVAEEEKRFINAKVERGAVYLMSEAEVAAAPGASLKRIVVNYVYTFLRKNLSESHKALCIPKDQLLKVGITYEIY